ncbi:hypothetical protein FRC17_003189 [Serendipita sp. 399]|nr:hypothetical protein FRC17_003189 [Serendipita sp. 399]
MPANRLLERVRERQRRFEMCDPSHKWHIPRINLRDGYRYELNNGFLARGTNHTSEESFCGIDFHQLLPPDFHLQQHLDLNRDHVGMTLVDFSFSIADDLLVLVEQCPDPRVRSDEPHPDAASPFVSLKSSEFPYWTICTSLLHYDYLAIGFSTSVNANDGGFQGCQTIYNWKTGAYAMPTIETSDVAFLPHHQALLFLNEPEPCSLGIYDLRTSKITNILVLPFQRPVAMACFVTCPPYRPDPTSDDPLLRMVPDPRLDVIGMQFTTLSIRRRNYVVVLSQHKLMQSASKHREDFPNETLLAWEHWGPESTRWFSPRNIRSAGYRAIWGSRILVRGSLERIHPEEPMMYSSLIVLDFNQRFLRRRRHRQTTRADTPFADIENEADERMIVESEWNWEGQMDETLRDIKSSLPFQATICRGPSPLHKVRDYHVLYLEQNTIVGSLYDHYDVWSFLPPSDKS